MAEKKYIERDELESRIKKYVKCRDADRETLEWAKDECIRQVHCMPAADVVEVRHGEWIEDGYCDIPCVCSRCGAEAQYTSTFNETFDYDWEENLQHTGYEEIREYIRTPYCPNCGAKMKGGVEE